MDGHFSDVQYLHKIGEFSNSFVAHYGQHFKSTTSCSDQCMCMTLRVVKNLIPIESMKVFTNPTCNLCMEERLTVLKSYVTNLTCL